MTGPRALFAAAVAAAVLALAAPSAGAGEKSTSGLAAGLSVTAGALARNAEPKPRSVPEDVVWWLYPVSITETSGRSAVRLTGWRKCYEGSASFRVICDPMRTNFDALFGTNVIPAGGTLTVRRPAWIWSEPDGRTIKVTTTYYGVDDQDRPLEAGYDFTFQAK